MKYLRYAALLALLAMPLAYSQAAVVVGADVEVGPVGVGIGVGPVGAPVCAYGYYPDYPYACAPYGYYGPSWFSGGVFIGAGPWYHGGWGRHYYGGGYGRGFAGRGVVGRGFVGRGPVGRGIERGSLGGHGFVARGPVGGSRGFSGGGRGGFGGRR